MIIFEDSGITQADIAAVQASWKPASENNDEWGRLLFSNLFTDIPEYETLFLRFKEKGKTVLESEQFMKHAAGVIAELSHVIELLSTPEQLDEEIKRIGAVHKSKSVKPGSFLKLSKVLGETLIKGGIVSEGSDLAASWNRVATYLLVNMYEMAK